MIRYLQRLAEKTLENFYLYVLAPRLGMATPAATQTKRLCGSGHRGMADDEEERLAAVLSTGALTTQQLF